MCPRIETERTSQPAPPSNPFHTALAHGCRAFMLKELRRRASATVTQTFGSSCSHRRASRTGQEIASPGATCSAVSSGGLSSESFLLTRQAVTPAVQDTYRRLVVTFLLFCQASALPLLRAQDIDIALVKFFESCFEDGVGPATGETAFSAWLHFFPEYRAGELPYAARALRGWRRL